MPPRPHRLEPLNGASHGRVPDRHKEMLFAKYGDLTSTGLVAPQIRDAAGLLGRQSELTAAAAAARGNGGGSQDDAPYVTRREFEDRLAQMEQRIALLASALRQQDDLTTRMSAALEEVLAKTAALPLPRPAATSLMAIAHDGTSPVDAGGMVVLETSRSAVTWNVPYTFFDSMGQTIASNITCCRWGP